jgi:hypothetical protein
MWPAPPAHYHPQVSLGWFIAITVCATWNVTFDTVQLPPSPLRLHLSIYICNVDSEPLAAAAPPAAVRWQHGLVGYVDPRAHPWVGLTGVGRELYWRRARIHCSACPSDPFHSTLSSATRVYS